MQSSFLPLHRLNKNESSWGKLLKRLPPHLFLKTNKLNGLMPGRLLFFSKSYRHALTFFDLGAYVVLRRHAASKGGIILNEMKGVTGQEYAEQAMPFRMPEVDCGCGDERVLDGVYAACARGCGHCDAADEGVRVCGFGVDGGVVASVYAPMQVFAGVYDEETAMRRGTMFEALDKPFYGDGREVDCRGREK